MTKRQRNTSDWEVLVAIRAELRKIRRLGLDTHDVPAMERRARSICEAHGWTVPPEVGNERGEGP